MMKSLFAAAAVAAIAMTASAPAEAKKLNLDVYIGTPGYYDPGYSVYEEPVYRPRHEERRYRPRYEEPRDYGISCDEGREQVRESGFHRVRAVSCNGRRYTYRARRDGAPYIIRVSRRSGEIISVQEAY
jgi:hypothetical protein